MSLMKTLEIPKSGKCGGTVWQRNRFCQYSHPAFVPFNPRTPAQVTVRGTFGAVSKRWRTLTQAQRDAWIAVARTIKSKPRLFQCGALTGCQLFVKVNVALVNQGKPQVDLPTEGRSKNGVCRNMTPKAVPGLLGGVFVSKRDTRSRGTPRLAHEASKARDVLELNKAKARRWFSKPISSWKSGKVALARLGACPRQCMKRLTPRRRNMAKIQTALRWRTRLRSSWALTSRRWCRPASTPQ